MKKILYVLAFCLVLNVCAAVFGEDEDIDRFLSKVKRIVAAVSEEKDEPAVQGKEAKEPGYEAEKPLNDLGNVVTALWNLYRQGESMTTGPGLFPAGGDDESLAVGVTEINLAMQISNAALYMYHLEKENGGFNDRAERLLLRYSQFSVEQLARVEKRVADLAARSVSGRTRDYLSKGIAETVKGREAISLLLKSLKVSVK